MRLISSGAFATVGEWLAQPANKAILSSIADDLSILRSLFRLDFVVLALIERCVAAREFRACLGQPVFVLSSPATPIAQSGKRVDQLEQA